MKTWWNSSVNVTPHPPIIGLVSKSNDFEQSAEFLTTDDMVYIFFTVTRPGRIAMVPKIYVNFRQVKSKTTTIKEKVQRRAIPNAEATFWVSNRVSNRVYKIIEKIGISDNIPAVLHMCALIYCNKLEKKSLNLMNYSFFLKQMCYPKTKRVIRRFSTNSVLSEQTNLRKLLINFRIPCYPKLKIP